MKKMYIFSVFFLCIAGITQAQKTFIKQVPVTWGQYVTATSDGGYLITGRRSVVKYSASDVALWTVSVKDSSHMEFVKAIPSADNGYIVISNTIVSDGSYKPEICKVNRGGKIVWQKAVFGYQSLDVAEDKEGNIVYAYDTYGEVASARLCKLDANGNILWQRSSNAPPFGDSFIAAIKITSDNSYAVAGLDNQFANFSVFDSNGNQVVNKTFNFSAGTSFIVDQFANGDYLFVTNDNNYGSQGAFVNRLTATGDVVWQKIFSQADSYDDFTAASISDSTIAFAGYKTDPETFRTTALITATLKTDGSSLSQQTISLPVIPNVASATRLKSGRFMVLASKSTNPFVSRFFGNSYIIRVGAKGDICNATPELVESQDNAIEPITADTYSTFTINTYAPILSGVSVPNVSETVICGDASLVAASSQKTAVSITGISSDVFTITTYPNPVVSSATVKINLPKPGTVSIELTDILGKKVLQQTYTLSAGISTKEINTALLAPNTYLLKVNDGKEIKTSKLIKL